MPDTSSFRRRLYQLREQRGISQNTLAERVGVAEETLRSWELGRRRPGKDTVEKLALALDFTPGTPEFRAFIAHARGLSPSPSPPCVDAPTHNEATQVVPLVSPRPHTPLFPWNSAEQRSRMRLINDVRAIWIDGVLHGSLHDQALIELGLAERADLARHVWEDVFPWHLYNGSVPHESQVFPANTRLIDLFDVHGAELLILGAPGSGKTTMLLDLAETLLYRADRDELHPIPVILNLASWAERSLPMDDWLIYELSERYGIAPRIGRNWIATNALLPLLDGLDEVRAEDRLGCVAALNQFHREHPCGLVVTSRTTDYDELADQLRIRSAIVLQPLSENQITAYVQRFGPRLHALEVALEQDVHLRELGRLPLMLSMLVVVYQDAVAETIPHGLSLEEQRATLFDRYVAHVFTTRRRMVTTYTLDQTQRWLEWLASHMTARSQSIFYPEALQYDSLPTWSSRFAYALFDRTLGAALGAILLGGCYLLLILCYGLMTAPSEVYYRYLGFDTLMIGLIGALVGGLFGGLAPAEPHTAWRRSIIGWFTGSLYFGVIGGLVAHSVAGAISYGIVGGAIGVFTGCPGFAPRMITVVAPRRWSWERTRRLLRVTVPGGLVLGGLMGVLVGKIEGVVGMLFSFSPLIGALFTGGIAGVLSACAFGISRADVSEHAVRPNQGIADSVRSAGWTALAGGALGYSIFALVTSGPLDAVLSGLMWALIGAAAFGGYTILSHYVLRFVLWWQGWLPFRLLCFLDLSSERILLQRIGGGYRFIHKLLQEHFAARVSSQQPEANSKSSMSPPRPFLRWIELTGLAVLLFALALALASNPHIRSTSAATRDDASVTLASGDGYTGRLVYDLPIAAGSNVHVSAQGSMDIGPFTKDVGPEGIERGFYGLPLGNGYKIVADFPTGALLCRIGKQADWMLCGPQVVFVASQSGRLEFLVNDTSIEHHLGAYAIRVDVTSPFN